MWKWNIKFYTSNKNLYTRSRNCDKHQEIDLSKEKNCFDKKNIVPSKEKCSEKEKKSSNQKTETV
jgi:hypothetical protein